MRIFRDVFARLGIKRTLENSGFSQIGKSLFVLLLYNFSAIGSRTPYNEQIHFYIFAMRFVDFFFSILGTLCIASEVSKYSVITFLR